MFPEKMRNNLFIALLLTSDWTAIQTESVLKDISDPTFGIYDIFTGAILYPAVLYIFSRKYSCCLLYTSDAADE